MSFEKRVLGVVESTLGEVYAGFYNGTLFVLCEVAQAVKLETALLEQLKCGIILSRTSPHESSFDFV
jgi:hypothetical protein